MFTFLNNDTDPPIEPVLIYKYLKLEITTNYQITKYQGCIEGFTVYNHLG